MTNKGTQTLFSRRLTLRQFTVDDAQAMYDTWASDADVTKYLFWDVHPNVDATRILLGVWVEQYKMDGCYNWAIEYRGALIGNISVVTTSVRDEYAEIGYCVGRAYWGQGIMTEALARVLRFLFEEVGLHRIYLKHDEQNGASGRVMVKNGMVYEGTLRKQHRRRDGTWADLPLYGILREEWERGPHRWQS